MRREVALCRRQSRCRTGCGCIARIAIVSPCRRDTTDPAPTTDTELRENPGFDCSKPVTTVGERS